MSIVGKLEDSGFSELIQFLSLNKKTGKLTLASGDGLGEAILVLREGMVVHAGSRSFRERVGNILLRLDLISEEVLAEALERQRAAKQEVRLGTILLEMRVLEERDLELAVRQQTARVMAEILDWPTGEFRFESMKVPRCGEVEIDAAEFLGIGGLQTDQLLLDAIAELDESRVRSPAAERPGERTHPSATSSSGAARTEQPFSVLDLLRQLDAPALKGEVTGALLRQAAAHLSRGILFSVCGHELHDLGHYGARLRAGFGAQTKHRSCLGLNEPSVLASAVARGETVRGPLETVSGNARLLLALGGHRPSEGVAIPVHVGAEVAMVFYGDNAPDGAPIGSIDELELALRDAVRSSADDAELVGPELQPVP